MVDYVARFFVCVRSWEVKDVAGDEIVLMSEYSVKTHLVARNHYRMFVHMS